MFKALMAGKAVAFACLLSLSACGGGGGGQGANTSAPVSGNVPTTPSNGVSVTVDKTELRFIGLGDNPTALQPESIVFSISGPQASGTYYAMAQPDANAGFDTYIADSSLTSLKVNMAARTTGASVDGSILFKLCTDQNCASVVWSRSIPYHIRRYTLDTSEIRVAGFEGATTVTTRPITPADPLIATDLKVEANTITPGGSAASWLSASADAKGTLVLTTKGAGLSPGNYTGTVSIAPANSPYAAVRIPVSMSLGTGFALPADKTLAIDASAPAVLSGSIALAFNGNQSPAWKAVGNKPWLVLQGNAGTGTRTLAYTIDTSSLASLGNFSSDTASVTFTAPGMRDAVYKVTVEKKLPEIISITPNPVEAGRAADVRLLGRGLAQLAGVSAIRIDNVPVASGTIVSDTQAVLTLPALTAGTHTVTVPVASGTGMPQPVLNAAIRTPMAAALIDSDSEKSALIFSAARSALYTFDRSNGKLLRYSFSNGNWINDKSVPAESSTRIGLSPDGATLYTTSLGRILEERDPDTLAVRATYTDDATDAYLYGNGNRLPVTNDGRIWFQRDQWTELRYFDTVTKRFGSAPLQGRLLWNARYAVSGDGSRMFVNVDNSIGPAGTLRYDPASGAFENVATIPDYGNPGGVLSENGKYVLFAATRLYESSTGRLVGQIPNAIAGSFYLPTLLSPDGSRAYVGAYTSTSYAVTYVRFDVVDTASMTKIGEIPLPADVSACASTMSFCSNLGIFVMSPSGDTIFWAGNKKIAVIPVPTTVRQAAGVARFKLAR
jgi:hypothetical protein